MGHEIDRRTLLAGAGGLIAAGAGLGALAWADDADAAIRSGQIATLSIPKIGLTKPIYEGIELNVLNLGVVGHGAWSPAPGQAGHCILFAHRTAHGGPFRRLNLLRPGDKVTTGGVTYTVRKTEVLSVRQKIQIWTYSGGARSLSLVACSKPNGQPTSLGWRICVRASA